MVRLKKINAAILAALGAGSTVASAAEIEEVIVTATKRAEPMQDIPVSIQAITGDALDELGIDSFDEYAQYLSNLVWSGRGPGRAELYIRGAATEQSSVTVSSVQRTAPSVALYQDEQPVSFAGRNLDIYVTDIERIEVLPGPQGTLFGASAQTGTVRLITNKPTTDAFRSGFEAKTSTTRGGDPSHALEAYVNMPLTDRLALRLAAFNDRAGGWIDNVYGTYAGNIDVMNRNHISKAAHICTGDPAVDGVDPQGVASDNCGGARATMAVADNAKLVEENFNESIYAGVRLGARHDLNDDWDLLVQHTRQALRSEGVFDYEPTLDDEQSVNMFTPSRNQDDFGLSTWTLAGRIAQLDVIYTGGYLSREVFYQHDYTGYTNGGGYQAYYICGGAGGGGYSNYTACFDPTKIFIGETTNRRQTHEFRFAFDPTERIHVTAGIFLDRQKTETDGEFNYEGSRQAGFDVRSAPGTITSPPLSVPDASNIESTVEGVIDPYGRGPGTVFVNNFTHREARLSFFGEVAFDVTDAVTVGIGARTYEIDYELAGSTGSSFGCKAASAPRPCDGQAFDNRVSERLEALGAFNNSGNKADLLTFFAADRADLIAQGVADGTFNISGLEPDGTLGQGDTIWRLTLGYRPSEDMLLFGAYSQGFRPQSANRNAGRPSANQEGVYKGYMVPATVKTDELTNVEAGIKADLLEGRLRLNATAYSMDITDLQVSRFDPGNVSFLIFIENAGDARSQGIDMDFAWLATGNLTVSGAASLLLVNELTRINPQLHEVIVPVGSRLPWAPAFRYNLRLSYDFYAERLRGDAHLRAVLVHVGESLAETSCDAFFVEDVARQVYGKPTGLVIIEEEGFCGTPLTGRDLASVVDKSFLGTDADGNTRFKAGRYRQQAYGLVNLSAGLTRDGWSAEFFIDNAFDAAPQLSINASDYTPSVTVGRPRTIGARFRFSFE